MLRRRSGNLLLDLSYAMNASNRNLIRVTHTKKNTTRLPRRRTRRTRKNRTSEAGPRQRDTREVGETFGRFDCYSIWDSQICSYRLLIHLPPFSHYSFIHQLNMIYFFRSAQQHRERPPQSQIGTNCRRPEDQRTV